MQIRKVTITPKLAKEMLEANVENNRNIRESRVNGYAADMLAEKWVVDSG